MFNSLDHTGTMLITNLIEMFRTGQIDLEEMWDIIDKEIQCQQYADICTGYEPTCICSNIH